ncbi:2-oxo-4-hydroxy-4-carboxy-5-ureidoimidazoline decarboxylase [Hydrogenophaga sp. A37]
MPSTPTTPLTITELRSLDEAAFNALLGSVVEHSPWVAERAWSLRPFASQAALFNAMARVIHGADEARQRALLCAHPELAGQEAQAGTMTTDSQSEQARLGLLNLDAATVQRIAALNQRYRERFGYPFIAALRLHDTLDSVFAAFEARLAQDETTERHTALQQICEVMRGRLARVVQPDAPAPLSSRPAVSTLAGTQP